MSEIRGDAWVDLTTQDLEEILDKYEIEILELLVRKTKKTKANAELAKKPDLHTYLIASLRGPDFEIQAATPENAWHKLVEREKENGVLWRTSDKFRNNAAVKSQGFTFYDPSDHTKGAWKLVE